mgnify:CR=1 FL=1
MKPGDLVVLRKTPSVAGALTAVKFYKRLDDELGNSHMMILKIHGNTASVLVNGYEKVLNLEFLEMLNENG